MWNNAVLNMVCLCKARKTKPGTENRLKTAPNYGLIYTIQSFNTISSTRCLQSIIFFYYTGSKYKETCDYTVANKIRNALNDKYMLSFFSRYSIYLGEM